jgi:urease accessory protein
MRLKAHAIVRAAERTGKPFASVMLEAAERHLRRRLLILQHGDELMVDLPAAARLEHGDCLLAEDGRLVEVIAAAEDLLAATAGKGLRLAELAWHLGNRHVEAQVEPDRILVRRDAVIGDLLGRLGATVSEVREPFSPLGGAYGHGADHGHGHGH